MTLQEAALLVVEVGVSEEELEGAVMNDCILSYAEDGNMLINENDLRLWFDYEMSH